MTFATSTAREHSSPASGLRPDRIHRAHSPKSEGNPASRQIGHLLSQAEPINGPGACAFLFGRFCLVLRSRELLADGRPVPIGNRALDVLVVLIEARGELVTKDELLSRVWPTTTVEENNLQFQISALRKALGGDRDFIKTVSGRGYRLIADVTVGRRAPRTGETKAASERGALPIAQFREPPTNLPAPTSDLVGREEQFSDAVALVAENRLVTLVGAGGIGKTRLGIELARRLLPNFADGVWLAELAPLSDPRLVPLAIATALGLSHTGGEVDRLATALAAKRLLLVLDNCEHVIDAAADVVEALLRASPSLHVIATSREPLRAEGEWVHRVPPLDVPPEGTDGTDEVLQHGAAKLFIARTCAAEPKIQFDARIAAATARICRHLDGIPLAIELAAASAAALGVEALACRLNERFSLLSDGRRTAPARQRTLRATLDWSYALLSEAERMVMRRLSVFGGAFTMEAASTVAASGEIADSVAMHCLASLVTKSLVATDVSDPVRHYRLLETERAYAMEKLTENGEFATVARRLAALGTNCAGEPDSTDARK